MPGLTFDHVSKEFPGGTVAVRDLSLAIADGEFMIFVGPSGCGKTTALRMVAGLEKITSGTIAIGDRVINDVSPRDRDIAMVFQNYALYPHMTVRKNLAFGLKERRMPKDEIEKRVTEVSAMLGIDDLLARRPAQLSGGQRQRVAMGRALVREPAAFLLDEPLSNLDAKLRVQVRGDLKRLHQRLGITTIYVTHDQVEAMTLGERVAVMSNGVLQQLGAPQDVYDHPANLFVAGFIGSPPMNLLRAEARGGVASAGDLVAADRRPAGRRRRPGTASGAPAAGDRRPAEHGVPGGGRRAARRRGHRARHGQRHARDGAVGRRRGAAATGGRSRRDHHEVRAHAPPDAGGTDAPDDRAAPRARLRRAHGRRDRRGRYVTASDKVRAR